MAPHPLDISNFLGSSPTENTSEKKTKEFREPAKKEHIQQASHNKTQSNHHQRPSQSDDSTPKIEKKFWQQLNPESRKIFTSRMWKSVDFNPMLSELSDLSKLTEKWLRWAIPTYANGIKEGPIRDWLNGQRGNEDFHYVLVGEHLKHLKEIRQKKKEEQKQEKTETTMAEVQEKDLPPIDCHQEVSVESPSEEAAVETPSSEEAKPSPELKMALQELDDHIKWFQNFLEEKPNQNDSSQS